MGDDIEAADLDKKIHEMIRKTYDAQVDQALKAPPMFVTKRLLDDSYIQFDTHQSDLYARAMDRELSRDAGIYRERDARDKYWAEEIQRETQRARVSERAATENHLVIKYVAEMTAAMVREDPYDEEGYADAVAFNDGLRRAILIVSEHLTLTAGSDPSIIGPSADT